MMYCSIADIIADMSEETLRQITDDSNSGEPDVSIINDKILEVSRLIDSYLAGRYTTPVTAAADILLLRPLAVSLTVCDLHQRRIGLDYSDSLSERRRNAMKQLEHIQRGIVKLASGSSATAPAYYRTTRRNRVFDDDTLRGY